MNFILKRFNELNVDELYKILRLRNEVFVVEQTCIYQECDDKDYNAYHLYLEEDNDIVAYLRVLDKGISYDDISIGRVLVKDTHRNKGISRRMMLKAIAFIENELNNSTIRISGQVYIKGFYESLGFKQVSEEYLEDKIPHVEMVYKK